MKGETNHWVNGKCGVFLPHNGRSCVFILVCPTLWWSLYENEIEQISSVCRKWSVYENIKVLWWGPVPCLANCGRRKGRKTEADYSTETLTPANLALCDWGHANIAENTGEPTWLDRSLWTQTAGSAPWTLPGCAFNGGSHFSLSKDT